MPSILKWKKSFKNSTIYDCPVLPALGRGKTPGRMQPASKLKYQPTLSRRNTEDMGKGLSNTVIRLSGKCPRPSFPPNRYIFFLISIRLQIKPAGPSFLGFEGMGIYSAVSFTASKQPTRERWRETQSQHRALLQQLKKILHSIHFYLVCTQKKFK